MLRQPNIHDLLAGRVVFDISLAEKRAVWRAVVSILAMPLVDEKGAPLHWTHKGVIRHAEVERFDLWWVASTIEALIEVGWVYERPSGGLVLASPLNGSAHVDCAYCDCAACNAKHGPCWCFGVGGAHDPVRCPRGERLDAIAYQNDLRRAERADASPTMSPRGDEPWHEEGP